VLIFSSKRLDVMNGWHWELRHCFWRYLLMPIGNGIDGGAKRYLGYTTFQFFGFVFFWHHKLTPEQERLRKKNGDKILAWVKKNGCEVE
jgi:hypothetical protein